METMELQKLPADLAFVLEKNIPAIAEEFALRYAQIMPATRLQKHLHELKISAEKLSKQETFELYGIDKKTLTSVYQTLERKAKGMGVEVEYADLTGFSEDKFHKNLENNPTLVPHAETARSDGKLLLLEQDLDAAGDIMGRSYDLLHLAFGHQAQWSTEDKNMLLNKEEAWSIGYRNHEKSPRIVLDLMSLYEFEAGMQGVEALNQVLGTALIPEQQKEAILQYFVDYAYADRDYIIQHYRGNHEAFQKFWKFGQPIPPRRELPTVGEFIKRHTVEIGLIQDKQKKSG